MTHTSRRIFLKAAGAAAAMPLLQHSAYAQASPNGRLQYAAVGVGGMGAATTSSIAAHPKVDVVAIYDVDANILNEAGSHYPRARRYADWREMLAKEEKGIDAPQLKPGDVVVLTIT